MECGTPRDSATLSRACFCGQEFLRRRVVVKPSPNNATDSRVSVAGSGTGFGSMFTEALTFASKTGAKASKSLTGTTKLPFKGFGMLTELIGRIVTVSGKAMSAMLFSADWLDTPLPMASMESASIPTLYAARAAANAALWLFGAPSVAKLMRDLTFGSENTDEPVSKVVRLVIAPAVLVPPPDLEWVAIALCMPGKDATVNTVGATTVATLEPYDTTVISIVPSAGIPASAAFSPVRRRL